MFLLLLFIIIIIPSKQFLGPPEQARGQKAINPASVSYKAITYKKELRVWLNVQSLLRRPTGSFMLEVCLKDKFGWILCCKGEEKCELCAFSIGTLRH